MDLRVGTTERNLKHRRWPRKLSIFANEAKITNDEPSQLAHALDLVLEAYAMVLRCDREVATLATVTALALGERMGLADDIVHHMLESAAAAWERAQRQRMRRRGESSRGR